jgi:hypothetical protein
VRSVIAIVGREFAAEPPNVGFVDRDDMIETFAARGANPFFRRSVLPGASNARVLWLNSRRLRQSQDFGAEFGITIQDGVLIWADLWKGLAQLLANPFGSWIGRYVEVQNPEVPWPQIVAFRSILIPAYFGIDWDVVWRAAANWCLILRGQIADILAADFGVQDGSIAE